MSTPDTAPQTPRLCPKDSFPLELDRTLLQASVDAGGPAVELLVCRNGHSVRADAPHLRAGPKPKRPAPTCPVCGKPVLRSKGSSRKMCSAACSHFVSGWRSRAYQRGEVFVLEEQPWFKGSAPRRAVEPLQPIDPLAGRMPRDWAEGWLRSHGLEPVGAA